MPLDFNSTALMNNSTTLLNTSSVTHSSSATALISDPSEVIFIIFLLPIFAVIVNFIITYYEAYIEDKKKQ